jgi:hypothetical protein
MNIKKVRIRYVLQFYSTTVQFSDVHETDLCNVRRRNLLDMSEAMCVSVFLKST